MRTRLSAGLCLLLLSALANDAAADHRFGLGVSQWGLLDSFDITTYRATYEFGEIEKIWNMRLLLGALYNFDNDVYYVSAGWLKEWPINPKWSWGFGGEAGYYDGDRLGYEIEFYTRLVLNWHVSQSGFVRMEGGHISNASFGSSNPGSENLAISYNWSFN